MTRDSIQPKIDKLLKERVEAVFAVWPDTVLLLERFLIQQKFKCRRKIESKELGGSMSLEYSGSNLSIKAGSAGGWTFSFAEPSDVRHRWHSFTAVRRLITWPTDEKVAFSKMGTFVIENWVSVANLFLGEDAEKVHNRLIALEDY